MFLISIVNHSRCSFRPLASVAPDRDVDAASLEPAQFIGELVGRHSKIDIVRLSYITMLCRYTSSCVGRVKLNVTISTIPHAVLIGSSSPLLPISHQIRHTGNTPFQRMTKNGVPISSSWRLDLVQREGTSQETHLPKVAIYVYELHLTQASVWFSYG